MRILMPGGFRLHGAPPGDGDAGLVPRVPGPRHPPEKSALGEGNHLSREWRGFLPLNFNLSFQGYNARRRHSAARPEVSGKDTLSPLTSGRMV